MARRKVKIRGTRSELEANAFALKKAWVLVAVLAGHGSTLSKEDLTIWDYRLWSGKQLKPYVDKLTHDFVANAKVLLLDWGKTDLRTKVDWFAAHLDAWRGSGLGTYTVGRFHEIEATLGKLAYHNQMDIPPYAELMLQGAGPFGIRHPEYHLGSDAALLHDLLVDSQALNDDALAEGRVHSTEHRQSLSRSVILTCFNLLEAFVTGLAVEWLMLNPNLPPTMAKKLTDNGLSLRKRVLQIPALITGRSDILDEKAPPFEPLLGECKQRRDSFVHCEPGPDANAWGYVKEHHFHDATVEAAQTTLNLTFDLIRLVWKSVHSRPGPTWLPQRTDAGRFKTVAVKLVDR